MGSEMCIRDRDMASPHLRPEGQGVAPHLTRNTPDGVSYRGCFATRKGEHVHCSMDTHHGYPSILVHKKRRLYVRDEHAAHPFWSTKKEMTKRRPLPHCNAIS